MNCLVCNQPLDGPTWSTTADNECHLACTDALLDFIFRLRVKGSAHTKGVVEIFLTGARLEMERERLRA